MAPTSRRPVVEAVTATPCAVVAGAAVVSAVAATWLPHLADQLIAPREPGTPAPGRPVWHRFLAGGVGALSAAVLVWRLPAAPVAGACILAAWLVFVQAGLLLAMTDLAARRLPTPIIASIGCVTAALLVIGAVAGRDPMPALAGLAGSVLLGGGYLAIAVLTPAGMGMGDVRLAALTGGLAAATGWDTALLATGLPYVLGLPFTIRQYRRVRRGADDRHLPFGPLLAAGAVTAAIITG